MMGSKIFGRLQDLLPHRLRGYRRLDTSGSGGTASLLRFRRFTVLVAVAGILLLSCLIFRPSSRIRQGSFAESQDVTAPGYIHLLIPASHPDPNLCKTVISASILGYPSPRLVNWGKTFENPDLVEGGSHLAKISGIKQYLDSLAPERDSDIVLMVDGYDIWFQLRPQTLLDRFFDINRRADERVRQELGAGVAERNSIRQNIVFSCQKRCWPWTSEDPPCYAVPESSLPADIYGDATDTDIGDEKNPYIKFRQRYLNSGVAMGTASAMRKLFTEALRRAEEDGNFGSDQKIFSQIFGDQEVYREVRRQDTTSKWERFNDWLHGRERRLRFKQEHLDDIRNQGRNLEFNLGVDYESSIGLATVFAEDDTEWLTMSNRTQIRTANAARGIAVEDARLRGLQSDIGATVPPFWTVAREPTLPRDTDWSDVSLFTDVWTGISPAIIHHNAHRDGLKSLRETWWDRIWFQPYARKLFDTHVQAPLGSIAISGTKAWWSIDDWKGGARDTDGEWVRYEDFCTGTEEEVFRDDHGPWLLPDDH